MTVRSARRRRAPRSWSLRTRLVVSSVTLIAVVCAVIGTVTTIALHSYLGSQLDEQLRTSAERSLGPVERPGPSGGGNRPDPTDLRFVTMPGQPIGTVGARVTGSGDVIKAARSTDTGSPSVHPEDRMTGLTSAQRAVLAKVSSDGSPHTVELPGLGDYRVMSKVPPGNDGVALLVALPTGEMQNTLSTLIVVEICVTAAGLVAAGIAGTVLVRIALRPLRRVAATATRVSELRLDRGEVELQHRVDVRDTDPRTEVGQVGAALNRMLGHVGSALAARHESETRVRQFVADASHELRTPLASIRGYAELTRRARANHAGATAEGELDGNLALARIEAQAERMTVLVEDLLLLARLDAGRPLERSDVSLSSLVVDAVSDARALGPGREWRLELPSEPVETTGDAARLQQVLVNLLANARTHTPEGTVITARVRTEAEDVVVEIEDDGPGIPPDALPRVFERFARGDASRSRNHGSTGLGLAIVRAVVGAHGGRVTAESRPGRTVFAVRLPARGGSDGPDRGGHARSSGNVAGHSTVPDGRDVRHGGSQAAHRFSTTP